MYVRNLEANVNTILWDLWAVTYRGDCPFWLEPQQYWLSWTNICTAKINHSSFVLPHASHSVAKDPASPPASLNVLSDEEILHVQSNEHRHQSRSSGPARKKITPKYTAVALCCVCMSFLSRCFLHSNFEIQKTASFTGSFAKIYQNAWEMKALSKICCAVVELMLYYTTLTNFVR